MNRIEPVIELMKSDDRQKAKEIAYRVIKRGNSTGERFGDILQEEVDKLKEATKDTDQVVQDSKAMNLRPL